MPGFSFEYVFVLLALLAYGAAGGFAIVLFRRGLRFAVLAAPMAGLLSVTLGTAVFYGIGGMTLGRAVAVSWIMCVATTGISLAACRIKPRWRELAGLAGVLLVTAVVVTRIVDASAVELHGPALHFADATDQMGYAQAADWLRMHPVTDLPSASADKPFDAWLTVLFQIDPRFGSHFFLASVSVVKGVSGAFAFDPACAVALSAALLALAGVFARSWASLAIVLAGLLVCHWYEDTRLGYFGKLLGYPGMLLVSGLFFSEIESNSLEKTIVLALLTAATAITHSGAATALLLLSICGVGLLGHPAYARGPSRRSELKNTWNGGLLLALLVGTSVMSSGIPARPTLAPLPPVNLSWAYLFPRVQDLEHQGANIANIPNDRRPPLVLGQEGKLVSGLKARALRRLANASAGIWAAFLLVAVFRRDVGAIGLLLGPAILLLVLRLGDRVSEAFQLIGVLYPAAVCALGRLTDLPLPAGLLWRRLSVVGLALAVIFVGIRVPRFVGSVRRYAGDHRPQFHDFALADIELIAARSAKEPVELDINSLPHLLLAMVELNNRGVRVQFTPSSYFSAFSYMGWETPKYGHAKMRLTIASDKLPAGWKVELRAGPYVLLTQQGQTSVSALVLLQWMRADTEVRPYKRGIAVRGIRTPSTARVPPDSTRSSPPSRTGRRYGWLLP